MDTVKRLTLIVLIGLAGCRAQQVDVARLRVPDGFHISVVAETGNCGARFMAWSPGGTLLATCVDEGKVLALPGAQNGSAQRVATVLSDLDGPHGIAFHNGKLYIGESGQVTVFDWDEAGLRAANARKLVDLPRGGMHSTRTVLFFNGKLYVSAGSDCNACAEKDPRRAAVMEFNEDGSGMRVFARGLRNSVGLAANPKANTIWATDNGIDWLGDDLPPDEVNELRAGGDYGWPYCYGDRVPNPQLGHDAARCAGTIPPKIRLQAHSAPLGLAFGAGAMFPAAYRASVYVAFHGSWNRSVPTGYKVIRVPLDAKGEPAGAAEDFVTGWLAPGETRKGKWMGRPVGVLFGADGSLFISDDASGHVYRVTFGK
ncbi:MAG: PQQ-dependent sugar dehydrogenase [Candidatus Koribacter versatilis]|uniref:PQQ-dependent sugar dehydrogenase n=1 Tax=Candidatus Korobacter versatilis TaxID=658062 RepID=A0A932A969_9BACT|nr:PQQ-dependent sugar dehydrogenase [Candidatus Koribacter versatilis]